MSLTAKKWRLERITGWSGGLTEQDLDEFIARNFQISSQIVQNLRQSSNAKLAVSRYGDMVLRAFGSGSHPHMASCLPRQFVSKASECPDKVVTAYVTRNLQAGMTSSFTIWRRITLGLLLSSKWQETASRTAVFNSSRESA